MQAFIPISAKRAAVNTFLSHSHSVPTVTSGTVASGDRISVVQNCCVREIAVISVIVPTLITATLIGTDSIDTLHTAVIWVNNLSQVRRKLLTLTLSEGIRELSLRSVYYVIAKMSSTIFENSFLKKDLLEFLKLLCCPEKFR